jgi:hypothetical protein
MLAISKTSRTIEHAVGGAKVGTCAAFDAAGQRPRQSSSLEGRGRPWLGTPDHRVTRELRCVGSPRRRSFSRTKPKP